MINLKNTNILLTGATGGIGNSILQNLVTSEANVVATGTNEEKLNNIKNKYQSVKVEKFDISKHNEIESFINKVCEKLDNKIDVLINNAGVTSDNLSIRMKEEEWKKVIDINLTSTFLLSKNTIKKMLKNKKGKKRQRKTKEQQQAENDAYDFWITHNGTAKSAYSITVGVETNIVFLHVLDKKA